MHEPVPRDTRMSSRTLPSIAGTLSRHLYSCGTMRRGSWLPPVLWMAVILFLSADTGSAAHTGRFLVPLFRALFPFASPVQLEVLHGLTRKLGHLTEYAVLAGLWLRAFARHGGAPRSAAWRAWVIAVA